MKRKAPLFTLFAALLVALSAAAAPPPSNMVGRHTLGTSNFGPMVTTPTLPSADTLPRLATYRPRGFWQQRTTQMGLGLIGAGAILSSADLSTRSLRQDYLPTFRYHYDDYLQYSPMALTYGLKAFGIEGRSSWQRLLVSDALSTGIMLSVVYVVKYSLGRLRPDGSTYNSFPSGHTAMAFTAASVLHKEYGTTVSPWWSVAGYSLATITGVSRALNNRHWLSDVVVGAGVGILSTELGYLLADKIFGSRGLRRPPLEEWEQVRVGKNPSYLGIGVAHNMLIYDRNRFDLVAPSGVGFSLEGAWFFSERLGVGGSAKVGRYAAIVNKDALEGGGVDQPAPINNLALAAGLFYNHPITPRIHLGAKTLVGVSRNHERMFELVDNGGNVVGGLEYDNREHATVTAGLSLRFVTGNNIGVRVYADYNYQRSDYRYGLNDEQSGWKYRSEWTSPLTVGVAVDALLW